MNHTGKELETQKAKIEIGNKSPIRDPHEMGSVLLKDHEGHQLVYDRFGMQTGKRDVPGNGFCIECNWSVAVELKEAK